jgi:hypothetical protein
MRPTEEDSDGVFTVLRVPNRGPMARGLTRVYPCQTVPSQQYQSQYSPEGWYRSTGKNRG